jgi:dipeptidyl aminopeptidase/acylaminoacyl peptidase
MKKIVLGIVIGVALTVGANFGRQGIINYVSSLATISPVSKLLEKPLEKYSILRLAGRTYAGSQIMLDTATATTSAYTVYSFHYESDGKKVTGVAHVPNTASVTHKLPVIVQLRGYVDQDKYFPGEETSPSAEVYASNGFITLAPDFLGYGGSDKSSADAFEDRFLTYTTALNLLASVKTLPMANAAKIGIWGHSNGGHIALTVLEILGKPLPASLWAPVSKPFPYSILYYSDEAEDNGKALRKELAGFEQDYNVDDYSLTNYFDRITGPIVLHQGSADDAVPQSWSDLLAKFLKDKGKDITYYVYPGADHNMQPGAWNTVVARDITFFTTYLR